MELAKRWVHSGGYWWLKSPDHPDLENRATIHGPTSDGYYHLEVWGGASPFRGWDRFAKAKNLRALKAIGRLEAARRLHV